MGSADPLAGDPSDPTTFPVLAQRLLLQHGLRVGEALYRFVEIEFYASAPGHDDPFTHRHPAQMTEGRWYFHQEGRSYRGGTFKGLDLTFGPAEVPTGILLRTLQTPDGELVNGSSNCVERLLVETGYPTVAALDEALGGRRVDAPGGPLELVEAPRLDREVLATARVGLTLARVARHPAMTTYFGRPYRFLTDPKVRKGKVQTVLALHRAGHDVERIREVASSTRAAVTRAIDAYERGWASGSLAPWHGVRLSNAEWAEAFGAWAAEVS